MMRTTHLNRSDYPQFQTGMKLFTIFFWFLCCNTIFGQIYISEGTTLIVENKTFISEKAGTRITDNFSEIHIADDSLHLTMQTKVPASSLIKTEKENLLKPEVKKNKIAKVPSYQFSSGTNQHFTLLKKNGVSVMVPVQNPTLLVSFQTVSWLDRDLAFFEVLSPQKLSEQYKNRPLYSSSAIRPPPSEKNS